MDLENFLQPFLSFAGTFSPKLVAILFPLLIIGEFGITIPYLLETIWLLAGYNLSTGALSPLYLVLLWLAALAGREAGVTILYYLSRFGSLPLTKLYHKYFDTASAERVTDKKSFSFRIFGGMHYLTPFSVAMGRLLWLRIPLTLALGVRRQLWILLPGVLLSSMAWDGAYIVLGMLGGSVRLKPFEMMLYSLAGLTVLYLVSFVFRRLSARSVFKGKAK